jgi:antitoxin YobK
MGLRELDVALGLIAEYPDLADFEGPKGSELVDNAEKTLGLVFPPSYREFLERLGAGSFGSVEVFGVIRNDFVSSGIPDGVWLTQRARKEWNLPRPMVVVYFDGATGYFAIDTSRVGVDRESPVVLCYPGRVGRSDVPQLMAADFGSFLLEQVSVELRHSRGATGPH